MAEAKTFHLVIARVDGPVFNADAVSVSVPAREGDMTVLAHHEPFISPLRTGTITVRRDDEETESFEIEQGTIEIGENTVSILL